MNTNENTLIEAAKAVRAHAYAPYSNYLVGAALLDETGRMHTGCNVENAAYPQGTCAEAGAIAAMIASGGRKIVVIAVVGGRESLEVCTPCGGCRQKIGEFSDKDTQVIMIGEGGKKENYSIAELLPGFFRLY